MELNYNDKKLLQEIISAYIVNRRDSDWKLDENSRFYNVAHSMNMEKIHGAEKLLAMVLESI